VDKFLNGYISFNMIPEIIIKALNNIENHKTSDLETIIECDKETRRFVENLS
jgi:1-deoxy-D-xylulose 5-phosphate reductoisomerase